MLKIKKMCEFPTKVGRLCEQVKQLKWSKKLWEKVGIRGSRKRRNEKQTKSSDEGTVFCTLHVRRTTYDYVTS